MELLRLASDKNRNLIYLKELKMVANWSQEES